MGAARIDLWLATDDLSEVERLDEIARRLGMELLELDEVTAVQKIPAASVPEGVRSGTVWEVAALSLVLGAVGYRAVTNESAARVGRVLTDFLHRHRGKRLRVEYEGRTAEIDADTGEALLDDLLGRDDG